MTNDQPLKLNNLELDGLVAFVTGAGSGIGRAAALRLAREGARVGVFDHGEPGAAETVRLIRADGGEARALVGDVSQPADVLGAVEETVRAFGRLDVVHANAGVNGVWAPLEELEPEEWDRTLAVNLKGTFLTVKHAVPTCAGPAAGRSSSPPRSTARASSPTPGPRLTPAPRPRKSPSRK